MEKIGTFETMIKSFLDEFWAMNRWQRGFFAVTVAGLIFYGLLHAGLVKLPPAKAYDCGKVSGAKDVVIDMADDGFHPRDITVTVCDRLVFKNTGQLQKWPAVGPHPTHTSYPGFDALEGLFSGQSFAFVVNRAGTYSIHDHLHISTVGTIQINSPNN